MRNLYLFGCRDIESSKLSIERSGICNFWTPFRWNTGLENPILQSNQRHPIILCLSTETPMKFARTFTCRQWKPGCTHARTYVSAHARARFLYKLLERCPNRSLCSGHPDDFPRVSRPELSDPPEIPPIARQV